MKRKNLLLSIFALLLIACAVLNPAVAYFTANTNATGAIPVNFQYRTVIKEGFEDWLKTVRIQNVLHPDPDDESIVSSPIWVRARAISGETFPLVENEKGNDDWVKEGKWWVYKSPLYAGDETSPIVFEITGIPKTDADDHAYSSFNVAVVYESTHVYFNEDGSVKPPNWSIILDTSGQP